jgi:hypothetical protein
MFQFLTLSSRRFQRGFDKVNLHRPTLYFTLSSAYLFLAKATASARPRL